MAHPLATSTSRFLTERLLDRDLGGVYRAVDAAGRRPLSTDKHLPDQSSTVLALVEHGAPDDLRVAVEGLLRLQDHHGRPGFAELADRRWRVGPAGQVRSIRFQFHAAAALLAAAHRLDSDELHVRAVDLLNRCLWAARDGRLLTRVGADWRTVLDGSPNPQNAVSAVRALAVADDVGETSVDFTALPAIALELRELVESARSGTVAPELRRCGALARIAVALTHAGRMLGSTECLKSAQTALGIVTEYFFDEAHGGFWDRVAADGRVRVDWLEAPEQGLLPCPIKRTGDTAHLLLAARLLAAASVDCADLAGRASAALDMFADTRHGGVFLGIGYRWLTPDEPAVPSPRQLWPAPRHPGVATDPGHRYVALQQKSAHANASLLRAVGDQPPRPVAAVATTGPVVVTRPRRPVTAVGPAPGPLLAQRLGTSRPGTPEVARQVSAAYRAVANLRLLGGSPPFPAGLTDQVHGAWHEDGGFGEQPGDLADLVATHRAVLVTHLSGQEPPRPEAVVGYLWDCGYAAVPGTAADLWHTDLALSALCVLGAPVDDPDAVARFVLSCRAGAGYALRPGARPDVLATRRAVSALRLLGVPVPDRQEVAAWLRDHQVAGGGFTHRLGGPVTLSATYHAVAALALLDERARFAETCASWLLSYADDEVGECPTLTGADDFACLQTLALLDGTASADWANLVS